jgi:hypothetical protein
MIDKLVILILALLCVAFAFYIAHLHKKIATRYKLIIPNEHKWPPIMEVKNDIAK